MRIVLADDDRDLVELVTMALEDAGHAVRVAFDGEQALTLAQDEDFDLALLDVRMPHRTGVECLREIRRLRPEARVVIMTGYSVEELLEEARALGAEAILHKPLDVRDLLRRLAGARDASPPG